MANNIRSNARNKLQSAIDSTSRTTEYLDWFVSVYTDEHPELSGYALEAREVVEIARDIITKLRESV